MPDRTLITLCLLLLFSGPTPAIASGSVEVDIVSDDGRVYPVHHLRRTYDGLTNYHAYLEAIYGENYTVRVRNHSDRRVGLVIAVDGRNIISGKKSDLRQSEHMYILGPSEIASYRGWRTSNSSINRFFFTDAEDSYAGAWQDHSAMGVIALAVFNERRQYRPYSKNSSPRLSGRQDSTIARESSTDRTEGESGYREQKKQAGTGFGEKNYSYARVVKFVPEKGAREKYFYRYEWREALCQQGIINCKTPVPNRFWPEQQTRTGYAPYPPCR